MLKKRIKFPQEPGYYFWYILDWGYFEIGSVQVLKDPEKHLAYLRTRPLKSKYPAPYIYQNDADETLTMYWNANGGDNPHLPDLLEDNKPIVDGFIPFDYKELMSKELKYEN